MMFIPRNSNPSRDELSRDWVDFFLALPGCWRYVNIPALHTLGLDFSDWRLGPAEALLVSSYHFDVSVLTFTHR